MQPQLQRKPIIVQTHAVTTLRQVASLSKMPLTAVNLAGSEQGGSVEGESSSQDEGSQCRHATALNRMQDGYQQSPVYFPFVTLMLPFLLQPACTAPCWPPSRSNRCGGFCAAFSTAQHPLRPTSCPWISLLAEPAPHIHLGTIAQLYWSAAAASTLRPTCTFACLN